ncbi:MAG: alpha/beta fold hydrolase [Chloroflexales bacterium]
MPTYAITEQFLEGQHGLMRYWASTPRQGVPVVLIHGYGGLIEHWRAVTRPIAMRHSLFALDLYFFGQSAIPAYPPDRQMWSEQVAELIATVCPAPAVVVGHSMGGMVAAQLAHDFPQLVRGLVLVAPTGLRDPANQPSLLDQALFSVLRADGVGEILAEALSSPWGARQGLVTAYHRKERVTPEMIEQFAAPLLRPGGAQAYLTVSRNFSHLYLEFERGAITAPTLLIWGEHDRSVPPSLAKRFKQMLLPQAEIAVLRETGHCPFDETPEAFLEVLLPWIAGLGA